MKLKTHRWRSTAAAVAVLALVSGCGGAGQASTSPSALPSASEPAAATSSAVASSATSPASSPTSAPGGAATLDGPASVGAGADFEASWTGPNADNDYITIVAVGTTKWTVEPYFYTRAGPSGTLPAPIKAGEYELWYVNGADDVPTARRPITVTPFAGTLDAPAQVQAGTPFQVAWTGPDGRGDYVTVVAAGATAWSVEPYFYTKDGSPGALVAAIEPGAYEVWYVPGQDPKPQVRRPLTVTPFQITLDAPATVKAGADFQVTWTGPNGPQDYVTIVPAGSPEGTYLDYAYTSSANPVTLTAPDQRGKYEIWYASDRVDGTFGRKPIVVD